MSKNNVLAGQAPEIPFPIPGATPNGTTAKILNLDLQYGPATAIIILKPGAHIPAHYHANTSEAHYVLEGDFIEAGETFGPGAYFSHTPGTVHGPHESKNGCSILTIQNAAVDPSDFHIAE